MSKNTINLLPKEERVKRNVNSSSKTISSATVFFFVVGLLLIIGGSVLIYTQKRAVDNLTQTRQELLAQVETFSSQEQQLVLLKDRVAVVNEILSASSSHETFQLHETLYGLMPEGVTLSEQRIGDNVNLYTFQSPSAVLMKNYIETVLQSPEFTYVEMNQLTYTPFTGYQVELLVR